MYDNLTMRNTLYGQFLDRSVAMGFWKFCSHCFIIAGQILGGSQGPIMRMTHMNIWEDIWDPGQNDHAKFHRCRSGGPGGDAYEKFVSRSEYNNNNKLEGE